MEASTSNDPDVKTFRGRSLEEMLPQIREELGPDAIVLRRREGLAGGVGGFFQRPFVEVEARGPLASDASPEVRSDGATAEGLRTPIVQTLVEQASPFADALARADEVMTARAGLYGPQPNYVADEPAFSAQRTASDPVAAPATRDVIVAPPTLPER